MVATTASNPRPQAPKQGSGSILAHEQEAAGWIGGQPAQFANADVGIRHLHCAPALSRITLAQSSATVS